MDKIYIAGPMTGYDKFNFPRFDYWKGYFEDQNFTVFSPADHDRELLAKDDDWLPSEKDSTEGWKAWAIEDAPSLRKMLGDDLAWIAAEANAMFMMKGWENSKGANAEWALAKALGLEIYYE